MIKLRDYQRDAVAAARSDIAGGVHRPAIVVPTGGGKGHPLDTEVPTPDGLRRWGDLVVGDQVYGSDGRPTTVTAIFDRGVLPVYRVTMKHGESVLVDGDHLWHVRRKGRKPQTVETAWLAGQPMRNYDGWVWSVPVAAPTVRPAADLPLHPYVIGALIANGGLAHDGTILTTPDRQVIERVREHAEVRRLGTYPGRTCPAYSLPGLTAITRELGMRVRSRDKRIPRCYLEASITQRVDLFHGLMDSDGSVRTGGRRSAQYHTTSPGLAEDVAELVTSLGGTCSVGKKDRGDKGTEYVCRILLPSDLAPTATTRKVAPTAPRRTFEPRSAIVSIEPAGTAPIRCITVAAPDSLYLITRNHIVTHNTIIFSEFIRQVLAERGGKAVVLVHRDELAAQAADKYRSVDPTARIGVVKAERNEVDADVIVASVQTVRNPKRLAQLTGVTVGVVDECHHATAASYRTVMDGIDVPWLGVTATLARSDGAKLGDVWQKISYDEMTVLRMIRAGHLVDVRGVAVEVPDLDLTGVRRTGGDYAEGDLGERLMESLAPETVAKAYAEHAVLDGKVMPGIVFTPTVETAKVFAETFAAAGFKAAAVYGAMPLEERRRVLRDYDEGRIDVLTNCMVLTEGFDSPRAQVCVIARPTQSSPLYVQMVGRVLRPFPGKAYALVLDVVGAAGKHELATLAVLGGQDAEPAKDGTVSSLLAEFGKPCTMCDALEEDCTREARCCEGCSHWLDRQDVAGYVGEVAARAVDLFGGSRQQWLQTFSGHWFIPAGDRFIVLMPIPTEPVQSCAEDCDGCSCHLGHSAPCSHCSGCWVTPAGGYDVAWCAAKTKGGGWIARGVGDLGMAMAHGEGAITREEEVLASKSARWRKGKASARQVSFALGLRVRRDGTVLTEEELAAMRQGAVGDLISVALASRRMDKSINARTA